MNFADDVTKMIRQQSNKTQDMISLKPCPICGGRAEMAAKRFTKFEPRPLIICTVCGLRTREYTSVEEAAHGWNKRV